MQENSTTHLENATDLIPFNYNGHPVRICREPEGGPWYIAQDVCAILELQDVSRALIELDRDEKTNIPGNRVGCNISKLRAVNEFGVYHLIFKSRKPEAKQFKRWLIHEVIPAIRRTGQYSVQPSEPTKAAGFAAGVQRGLAFSHCLARMDMTLGDLAELRACRKIGIEWEKLGKMYNRTGERLRKFSREMDEIGLPNVAVSLRSAKKEQRRQLAIDMGLPAYAQKQLIADCGSAITPTRAIIRRTRVTDDKRKQVISLLNQGKRHTEIAATVGCSVRTVDRVFNQEVAS